jgi:hypothetical protein
MSWLLSDGVNYCFCAIKIILNSNISDIRKLDIRSLLQIAMANTLISNSTILIGCRRNLIFKLITCCRPIFTVDIFSWTLLKYILDKIKHTHFNCILWYAYLPHVYHYQKSRYSTFPFHASNLLQSITDFMGYAYLKTLS